MQEKINVLYDGTAWSKEAPTNPLDKQVGGDHYKHFKIQPVEFCLANNTPFVEASIIKHALRHRLKGGRKDLEKIKHYCDILIAEYYTEDSKEQELKPMSTESTYYGLKDHAELPEQPKKLIQDTYIEQLTQAFRLLSASLALNCIFVRPKDIIECLRGKILSEKITKELLAGLRGQW